MTWFSGFSKPLFRHRGREGYVVLVSEAGCGHWIGYMAFHQGRPEEAPLALECDVPLRGDPRALYVLDS